jgi:hypothetical protein
MTVASVLTVNGTAYAQPARHVHGLILDAWGWDVDSDFWAEFHEVAGGPQPQFNGPLPCSITMGSGGSPPLVFSGEIVDCQPGLTADGRTWGYRALGLKYAANWIPVTAVDGSGLIRFNVSPTDIFNYSASMAGQSVGQILAYCLTLHSTVLAAAGITTDSTTASQLAALTLVPNSEVDVRGERLWQPLEAVCQQWARNIRLVILPSGLVRVIDITTGTAESFTVGTDDIDIPLLRYNWTNCATRVVVRGQGLIEPGYVETAIVNSVQSLTPAWNNTEQNNWNLQAFTNPSGATDNGSCTVASATTINCTSVNGSLSLATNYWDTVQGWIYVSYSLGTGLTFTESRAITASTSTSTGVYTVTVNYAFTNTNYDSYKIIGTAVPLSAGGLSLVWRLYNVTDPGSQIADHLVRMFPTQVPFEIPGQAASALTSAPTCQIQYQTNGGLGSVTEGTYAPFQVLPATGQILFTQPVVMVNNSSAQLATGGSSVTAPSNIIALLPYSRGALEAIYPPNSGGSPVYAGTAYSVNGLQRTQYVDVPSWTYYGDVSVLNSLAQMLWQAVSNTIIEGTISFKGLNTTMAGPTGGATPGYVLNIHGNGYTTGLETAAVPVRAQTVRYVTDGASGLIYSTEYRVSSRHDPRTGESFYDHLHTLGTGAFVPRSESNFGPNAVPLPDTHNPFGFSDDTPDFSGFEGSLGLDGGNDSGRYEPRDAQRKRRLRERGTNQPGRDRSALGLPADTGKYAGLTGANAVSLPGVGASLERAFPSGIEGSTGSVAAGTTELTPLDPPAPAVPFDESTIVKPKERPTTTSLPGAPTSAPSTSPEGAPSGRLPETRIASSDAPPPSPDFGTPMPD